MPFLVLKEANPNIKIFFNKKAEQNTNTLSGGNKFFPF